MRHLPDGVGAFSPAPGLVLTFGKQTNRVRSDRFSRSRADGITAELVAASGCVGVDIETFGRIAANVRSDDPWLTARERRTVEQMLDPTRELACRWVLKEAYAKALGLGLALPPEGIGFIACRGRIVREAWGDPGWTFLLLMRGRCVIGIAHQAATPLTPAGKKPPTPPLERYTTFRI